MPRLSRCSHGCLCARALIALWHSFAACRAHSRFYLRAVWSAVARAWSHVSLAPSLRRRTFARLNCASPSEEQGSALILAPVAPAVGVCVCVSVCVRARASERSVRGSNLQWCTHAPNSQPHHRSSADVHALKRTTDEPARSPLALQRLTVGNAWLL
jgi:hypothetical protein